MASGIVVGVEIGSAREAPRDPLAERAQLEVKPVYAENVPADALAGRICAALHTLPAERRAQCEGRSYPGFLVTPECVRTLSAALAGGAVRLSEAAVTRCEAAAAAAHADCSFTAQLGARYVPECDRLIQGRLSLGQACRSSLECGEGLQCAGVGPADPGVCAKPFGPGQACGIAVDPLAVYTKQRSAEETHPVCEGYCSRHRCAAFSKRGEACASNVQCGPQASCVEGRCG